MFDFLIELQQLKEAKISSPDAFINAFKKKFPDAWMKMLDGAPTTGEGASVDGFDLFNPHINDPHEKHYQMGVLKKVVEWSESMGWHPEAYDSGTLKFYKD